MGAVVQYAKTRPVVDGYKAAKYSRKYLAEHEAELADYRAAKATMGELLGGEKLPKMARAKRKTPPTGGAEKGTLCRVPLGAAGNAAVRGGQEQH